LLPSNDAKLRRGVLEAIIEAVDCHGALVEEQGDDTPAGGAQKPPGIPLDIHTVGGLFAYALVPSVSTGMAGELAGVIDDIGHGHYEGIVLDIRFAGGGEMSAVERVVGELVKGKLPVVVLINSETVGAAEVLALQARKRCDALTVGQPTRGLPYPRISERLSSGDVVLLPEIGASAEPTREARAPVLPDVPVEQALTRETLVQRLEEQPTNDDGGDLCLRRAVDLLTMIHALNEKRF